VSTFEEKLDLIREHVSIYDLFDAARPRVKYDSREIPCQISCPFHGRDLHKSTRVYPDSNSFYCWSCDKSWDVVAFWAQANEWWKDDGRLDYGKAVGDLMVKFNLRSVRPDWTRKLNASLSKLKDQRAGYETLPMADRERLRSFYAGRVAKAVRGLTVGKKREVWKTLFSLWDSLDAIDLDASEWKQHLADWDTSARTTVAEWEESNVNNA
jgi:hypothetical protein